MEKYVIASFGNISPCFALISSIGDDFKNAEIEKVSVQPCSDILHRSNDNAIYIDSENIGNYDYYRALSHDDYRFHDYAIPKTENDYPASYSDWKKLWDEVEKAEQKIQMEDYELRKKLKKVFAEEISDRYYADLIREDWKKTWISAYYFINRYVKNEIRKEFNASDRSKERAILAEAKSMAADIALKRYEVENNINEKRLPWYAPLSWEEQMVSDLESRTDKEIM